MFLGQDETAQLKVSPVSIYMPMPDVQTTDTTIYLPQTPIVYPSSAAPSAAPPAAQTLGQLTDTGGTYSLPLLMLFGFVVWLYMRKK